MHRLSRILVLAAAAVLPAGCGLPEQRASAATTVDSVLPREEALRRFRAGLPAVESLSGGAPSREALVRAFVRALERADTVTLRALVMDRAEFAWLYYPTNPMSLPPYDLPPALMWFQLEGRSRQGIATALEDRGGRPLGYRGYRCEGATSVQGENRVWGPCLVRREQGPGDVIEERLFGPILERGGRYKFVSYANRL